MKRDQFQKLSRLEQGQYLHSELCRLAELLESIELEEGQTTDYARQIAESCGWRFCDHCNGLTETRDEWGNCEKCSAESEAWAKERREMEKDYFYNVIGGK